MELDDLIKILESPSISFEEAFSEQFLFTHTNIKTQNEFLLKFNIKAFEELEILDEETKNTVTKLISNFESYQLMIDEASAFYIKNL